MEKNEIVDLLEWVNKTFDISDGDYYWKKDDCGDKPLSADEILILWDEFKGRMMNHKQ